MDDQKSNLGAELNTERPKRVPLATTNGAEVVRSNSTATGSKRRRVRISSKSPMSAVKVEDDYGQQDRRRSFDKESSYDRPRREYPQSSKQDKSVYEERYRQKRQERGAYDGGYQKPYNKGKGRPQHKSHFKSEQRPIEPVRYDLELDESTEIRLNKFLSNAGVCSRREADEMITAGKIQVNGVVVTELGKHVTIKDEVKVEDKVVELQRKVYILLNKPKNTVTTSDDPEGRTTVLDVINRRGGNFDERIYPVGRLDRHTTGVLLLTNDGDLAMKLIHPKFEKRKVYQVWLDKPVAVEHMQQIAEGLELEDGEIHADAISYIKEDDFSQVGIEIHSGRNRIVRRIFEHLGYKVRKLDRVYFAGLTKKNLPRGKWRYLNEEEVRKLRTGQFE